MPICSSCAAELRPEWKFCIACGVGASAASIQANPASSAALAALLASEPLLDCAPDPEPQPEPVLEPEPQPQPTPVAEPEPTIASEPDQDDLEVADLEVDAAAAAAAAPKFAYLGSILFSVACFVAAGGIITWLAINVWF